MLCLGTALSFLTLQTLAYEETLFLGGSALVFSHWLDVVLRLKGWERLVAASGGCMLAFG